MPELDDLIALRRLRGLTQAQVAARAHVSHTTVSRAEHSHPSTSLSALVKIVMALGGRIRFSMEPLPPTRRKRRKPA